MRKRSRYLLVTSQIVVILAFFAGMILNYVTLLPILDLSEDYRLTDIIDEFCDNFYPEKGCDITDRTQLDSLMKKDPFKCGDLIIMNGNADILYTKDGQRGSGYDILEAKYGKRAVNLLRTELATPMEKSRMDYDPFAFISMYACFEPSIDTVFFYAVDYRVAGRRLYLRLVYLLIFMLGVGTVVIIINYIIGKIISAQTRKESLSQQELDTAAAIQKSMLPRGEKGFLQLDVSARLLPAKKVGGDFYCYVLRDGLLYFCIGDVSGKGVPASLFMSKAVTLFRSCANARLSATDMASNLNYELCTGNEQNMFMTGIVGTIRTTDGKVTYVNAGHEPPIVWNGKEESKVAYLDSKGNIPFGIMSDMVFEQESFVIEKNGLLLLYTDGISEARNRHNGLLGRSSLQEIIEPVKTLTSKEITDHLLEHVLKYESGAGQSDDITILTFRNIPSTKRLLIRNDVQELKKIIPFVGYIFDECMMDSKEQILVRAGLDEALTNCVLYAYDSPGGEIEVEARTEDGNLIFTIKDSGKPFNPLEYIPAPSEELKVGGLGISIYRANFDDVRYSREEGRNILKLIKKL